MMIGDLKDLGRPHGRSGGWLQQGVAGEYWYE